MDWYWPVEQFVSGMQTRSCGAFPLAHAVLWNWPAEHVMHGLHMRLLVAVGAIVWNWPVVQLVSGVQTRFCALFPFAHAALSYCPPLHVVHALQTRLLVGVGAVLWY
jgi:hypothetical protein